MKMNKNILLKIMNGLLFAVIIFLLVFIDTILYHEYLTEKNDFDEFYSSEKVILFIGDGMGENHIKVTEEYLDRKMFFSSTSIQGEVTTFSNAFFSPTDSAASATAMATGIKVFNKQVAYSEDEIKSITEIAKNLGKGVGIVTTDYLYGATPACFSSHTKNRNNTEEIINDQINSNIDIFLGAGWEKYYEYKDEIEKSGYTFCDNYSQLDLTSNRIFGSFSTINNYDFVEATPTLKSLVDFAIDFLDDKYPSGYFLMVEGAHIDKMSHDNNIFEMIKYLDEFNNAIEIAYNKISNSSFTMIITADHETGGLKYTNEKELISNKLFTRTYHSKKNVPYFIYSNTENINDLYPNTIDNTDIFKICFKLINK